MTYINPQPYMYISGLLAFSLWARYRSLRLI